MRRQWWLLFAILFGSAVMASGTSMNSLTKGLADTLYCPIANCTAGAAPVTGSGTTNQITKWTTGTTIGDSIIAEAGTMVTVDGNFTAGFLYGNGSGINSVNCSMIIGGNDTDFCSDESGGGGGTGGGGQPWNATGNTVILNNTDANVGIGNVVPTQKLEIEGNATINSSLRTNLNITYIQFDQNGDVGVWL